MDQSVKNSILSDRWDWLLRPRPFTSVTVGICLILCSLSAFWGYYQYEAGRERALASDQITTRLLADIIEGHQKAVIGILESYAGRPPFSDAVKEKDPKRVTGHLADLKKNHEIDLTFVTDEKGFLLANFPSFPEALGKDLSDRDWCKGVSAHWSPYISRVFRLIVGDRPLALAIAVPVFDDQRRVVGILASSQRLSFIGNIVERVPLDPNMTLSVIDGDGRVLFSNKDSGYEKDVTSYRWHSAVQQARQENRRRLEAPSADERRGKTHMAIAPLGAVGWTVVAERAQRDILSSQLRDLAVVGILTLLICLMVVFLLLYFRNTALLKRTAAILAIETALRESEEKFRLAFDNANTGMCLVGLDGTLLQVNDKMSAIFGYGKSEMEGMSVNDLALPENSELSAELNHQAVEGGEDSATLEKRYRHQRGHIIYGHIASSLVRDARGEPLYFISQVMDITERKKAETDLERMRNMLSEGQRIAHMGAFEYVAETRTTVWSEEEYRIYGLDPASPSPSYDAMLAKSIHPDDAALLHRTFTAAMQSNSVYELEHRIVRPDGSVRWVYDCAHPYFDERGALVRYIGSTIDITDRKRDEESLRESKAKLEAALASMTDAVFISDAEGRFVNFNEAFATFHRFKNKSECLETLAEYPEILDVRMADGEPAPLDMWAVPRALRGEAATNAEYSLRRKDTGESWVGSYSFGPIRDQDGTIVGSVVVGRDITERKRAEDALKVSEERLHLALDAAKAGTWEWDLKTNENFWSEELFRLHGLEPHSRKPSYESWRESVHPEDREKAEQAVQEAAAAGTELRAEWRAHSQDGGERWLMSRGRPVCDAQGAPIRYIGIVIDITERKRSEIELSKSLRDNIALLKEIHHRVKNNLQVVVSLLGLQAGTIKNPELHTILEDTRNRVRSMALLHEALYRSGDFANIRFGKYIDNLCRQIVASHGQLAQRVKVERRLDDIDLSLDQAVPCALIVNELVSNALKHAFPNNRPGSVVVSFERSDEQLLLLRVRDDGVGMPPGINPSSSPTLGLLLVSELTGQLLGHLTVERPADGGADFRVSFPIPANASQRGEA